MTVRDAAGEILGWLPGHGFHPDRVGPAELLVADSWLVEQGSVRGLELHHKRFAIGCAEAGGIDRSEVDRFWRAMRTRLPHDGEWFPRVELIARDPRPGLRLRVRTAPARTDEAHVWVPAESDTRTLPRRKGPDLDRLGELRQRAAEAGANEALLTTDSGYILEAANSSVLWWEDDQLCVPDPSMRLLPGVTVALIEREAHRRGLSLRRSRRRLPELDGCEVWLANALHGIRPVVRWAGSEVVPAVPTRGPQWQQWWRDSTGSLPKPSASPESREAEIVAS